MHPWELIYKEKGILSSKPHDSMPGLVKMFKHANVRRVLDVCCGTGRHTVYLAKEGFDVLGFDSSPTAIRLAREWLATESLDAELIVHDMNERFPYDDSSVDAAIAFSAIHHTTTDGVKLVLAEIRRVLKPGSILFVTVPKQRHGKARASELGETKYEKLDEYTYVPLDGQEKGLPHFYFENEKRIRDFFKGFDVKEITIGDNERYQITAVKQ